MVRWLFMLKSRGGVVGLMKIFSMTVMLSSNLALAYLLPKQEFGLFLYISGFIAIVGAISTFGITALPVRFASIYWDDKDAASLRGLVLFSFAGCVVASILAALIVYGWSFLQWSISGEHPSTLGPIAIWCIIILNFQGLLLAFGRSLEWHGISQFVELIAKPFAVMTAIALLWANKIQPSANSVLLIQFGTIATACAIQAGILYGHSKRQLLSVRQVTFRKEWLSYCGAGYMQTVVASCSINIELFVVGLVATASDTAVFGLAYRVTSGLGFFRNIGGIVAAPRYLRIARTSDDAEAYVWTSIRWVFLPTLVTAVVLVSAALSFERFFPTGYEGLSYALCVLTLSQVIRASMGNIDTIVSVVLRPWTFGLTSICYYPFYAGMIFLAYRYLGLAGALWTTALGTAVLTAICIALYVVPNRSITKLQ